MSNFGLRYFSIPMEQNTNDARQTTGHRDLAPTQHRYKSPAHFTGTLCREGRSEIVRHSEQDAGNIFGLHFTIRPNDCFKQFTRGLQDKVGVVCSDGYRSTNSTDWHELLLRPHPGPSPSLEEVGRERGEEK